MSMPVIRMAYILTSIAVVAFALTAVLWQNLMEHLTFDGNGKVLDVGCGSGAFSIRVVKTYEQATEMLKS